MSSSSVTASGGPSLGPPCREEHSCNDGCSVLRVVNEVLDGLSISVQHGLTDNSQAQDADAQPFLTNAVVADMLDKLSTEWSSFIRQVVKHGGGGGLEELCGLSSER